MPFLPSSFPRFLSVISFALFAMACPAAEDFLVRSWQSEDGLPGNVLRSVAQAADGYLWVATAEGVVRFDGVRFSGFDEEPDATLAALPMRGLFPMENGDVWIATARGGLLRWYAGRLQPVLRPIEGVSPLPQNESVTQVVSDPSLGVLAFRGAEIWRVDGADSPRLLERTETIEQLRVADADAWKKRGRVLSTGDSLRLVDRRKRVWSISSAGTLVVTNEAGGQSTVDLPMTAGGLRIAELCEDREGNIWAATGESGLIQVRARRANVLSVTDGLSDRTALSVLQDRSGSWWVGSKGGGVDRITNGVVTHVTIGEGGLNRPVSALFEDRDGVLWAATRNGSVFRLQDGAFRTAFNGSDAPSKVTGIAQDSGGTLWVAGLQGLARSSGGNLTRVAMENVPGISTLAIDEQDQLWIGTSQGKLFHGTSGKIVAIDPGNQFPVRAISSFHIDTDGSVWISSVGGGLMLWRAGRLTRISTAAGLPDSRLTAVLDDGAGNLWLGSLGGIFRVARAELNAIADGQQTSANWLQLDRADGLLSRECTGIFQPAAWRGADGGLWFPTVNGVVQIRPDRLSLNPLPPQVAIEACAENGKRIPLSPERLRLGPGRTRLEFRYTALSLTASEKIRFRVRLDGLENEWRDVDALREVAYEAVPAGRYEFQVMAANADGVWAKSAAGVLVEVRPHFWETRTLRVLAGFAAVAAAATIGWLVARARMRRRLLALELRHAREAERARIARDLHDDLGASLTEISMLADVTAEETPNESARAPLEQIAARAHALVGALDEIVWAVNPRHDTLGSLADYLAATAADFAAAAGLALRLDVPRDLPACEVDSERRHSLLLAMREALHNVVKHSAAEEVWLRMKISSGVLEITIEDNGCGFDAAERSAGDGLPNLSARLDSIGGQCRIESSLGSGTSVILRVPLGPDAMPVIQRSSGESAATPAHR